MKTNSRSPRRKTVSIASRVVPGWSETITRSSPSSAFSRLDLPTFGRPRIATRIAASVTAGRPRPGSRATIESSRSPVPWPWAAEPEPVKLERERVLIGVVDLVRDEHHRLVRRPQDLSELLVARRDARPRVGQEEDEVGLGDGR